MITNNKTIRWVVQGYLAVSPSSPKWCDIEITAVNGWWLIFGDDKTRATCLTFSKKEAADMAWTVIEYHEQCYHLRMIQRVVEIEETILAGAIIENGRIVPEHDGRSPKFMNEVILADDSIIYKVCSKQPTSKTVEQPARSLTGGPLWPRPKEIQR